MSDVGGEFVSRILSDEGPTFTFPVCLVTFTLFSRSTKVVGDFSTFQ